MQTLQGGFLAALTKFPFPLKKVRANSSLWPSPSTRPIFGSSPLSAASSYLITTKRSLRSRPGKLKHCLPQKQHASDMLLCTHRLSEIHLSRSGKPHRHGAAGSGKPMSMGHSPCPSLCFDCCIFASTPSNEVHLAFLKKKSCLLCCLLTHSFSVH